MTVLVKNVQIIGSEQKLPDKLDVFISGEKIAAIGRFPGKSADKIIEGQGCKLVPGFIDVHNKSDHYLSLFTNPSQGDLLKQGITSVIGGHCGASLAPLIYGSLESIEEWTDTTQINVDWHSIKDFLKLLEKRTLNINFGTLIGHNTVRSALIGKTPRNLTKNELKVFGETFKKALSEGGLGLSTGLGYAEAKDTPYQELRFLAEIVKSQNAVYSTHLRNDSNELMASVEETLKLANETGLNCMISHLMPTEGKEEEYEKSLEEINRVGDSNFHFSVYPFTTRILKLYTFLPEWAQKDSLKVMYLSLKDEWLRSKIAKDIQEIDAKKFVIAQAPGNDFLVGYTLSELKKTYSCKTNKEALLKLMLITRLQALIFYENISEKTLKNALTNKHSLIASNTAAIPENSKVKSLKPERATSTFTKFLNMTQKEGLLSIEEAIEKITKTAAEKFHLAGRGVVKEGYFADLVGIKDEKISFVLVNGKVAVENEQLTGSRSGKILRRQT